MGTRNRIVSFPLSLAMALGSLFLCSVLSISAQEPTAATGEKKDQATAATPQDKPGSEKGAPAAANGESESPEASVPPKLPGDYRVGAEDELLISVWHEPELSQLVVVRPDGVITLPLLNEVKVAGLTSEEMQTLLTEKLKSLVNDPQVTVIVKGIHSRKIFLMGNVAKQGVYVLGGKKTVLELIAEAGGLGPFAKSRSIYVLRKENGKEVRIPFNYKKALSGKGSNPELVPGDMVVVP